MHFEAAALFIVNLQKCSVAHFTGSSTVLPSTEAPVVTTSTSTMAALTTTSTVPAASTTLPSSATSTSSSRAPGNGTVAFEKLTAPYEAGTFTIDTLLALDTGAYRNVSTQATMQSTSRTSTMSTSESNFLATETTGSDDSVTHIQKTKQNQTFITTSVTSSTHGTAQSSRPCHQHVRTDSGMKRNEQYCTL